MNEPKNKTSRPNVGQENLAEGEAGNRQLTCEVLVSSDELMTIPFVAVLDLEDLRGGSNLEEREVEEENGFLASQSSSTRGGTVRGWKTSGEGTASSDGVEDVKGSGIDAEGGGRTGRS